MKRPTHIRVFVLAAVAAALVCLVGAASAVAVKRASTTSTLVFKSPNNFSGDLSSKNKRCIGQRLVNLYYLGPSGMSSPQFVEAAQTDSTGHFEINSIPDAVAGNYDISITKRKIKKANLLCKAFVSAQYTF